MIHHARTAGIRWQMINILNKARPHTTSEHFLLDVLRQCNAEHQAVIAVLHDYEQVRAYFPNTLLIAREKITAGKTEEVLTEGYLQQANEAMQRYDYAQWCAA